MDWVCTPPLAAKSENETYWARYVDIQWTYRRSWAPKLGHEYRGEHSTAFGTYIVTGPDLVQVSESTGRSNISRNPV